VLKVEFTTNKNIHDDDDDDDDHKRNLLCTYRSTEAISIIDQWLN